MRTGSKSFSVPGQALHSAGRLCDNPFTVDANDEGADNPVTGATLNAETDVAAGHYRWSYRALHSLSVCKRTDDDQRKCSYQCEYDPFSRCHKYL
jgi:hypothetical protein